MKDRSRNLKLPEHFVPLDLHIQMFLSHINTVCVKHDVVVVGIFFFSFLERGGKTGEKKKEMAREIKKAWGNETEMRDGDLKMRQQEMKGWKDQH